MTILHLADLHINERRIGWGKTRLDDLINFAEKLVEYTKNKKLEYDTIFILGDIFDVDNRKASLSEIECILDFINIISSETIDTFIIRGNHDRKCDKEFDIINKLPQATCIDIDAFKYLLLHRSDSNHPFYFINYDKLLNKDYQSEITIDLEKHSSNLDGICIHGPIYNSKLVDGKLQSGIKKDILKNIFKSIDNKVKLLMGDIHLPQEIKITDNVTAYYCGSPVPIKFGEEKHKHGAYLHNMITKRSTYIDIPYERELTTIELGNSTIEEQCDVLNNIISHHNEEHIYRIIGNYDTHNPRLMDHIKNVRKKNNVSFNAKQDIIKIDPDKIIKNGNKTSHIYDIENAFKEWCKLTNQDDGTFNKLKIELDKYKAQEDILGEI